jgi:hypothetical protein
MKDTQMKIAVLNDTLRRNFAAAPHVVPGCFKVLITQGAGALEQEAFAALIDKVERFDAFTTGNDPHGEHDFGAVEQDGVQYFWKIDYYGNAAMDEASADPADPALTCRLLTIMRADEY